MLSFLPAVFSFDVRSSYGNIIALAIVLPIALIIIVAAVIATLVYFKVRYQCE